jgi:hypothetical protein
VISLSTISHQTQINDIRKVEIIYNKIIYDEKNIRKGFLFIFVKIKDKENINDDGTKIIKWKQESCTDYN